MAFAKITEEALAELRARIGKSPSRKTPPFYTEINTDAARHFAHAMGDDNPLYCDPDYGPRTRWGIQLAPPCILYSTDNVCSGAIEGLPSIHAMYAGTNFMFHQPIRVGTKISTHSFLKELVEIPTKFAGRSIKQVYTTIFHDQHGVHLADADAWVFRTERDTARERTEQGGKYEQPDKETIHRFTVEELQAIALHYRNEKARGAQRLRWDEIHDGDRIPTLLRTH